MVGTDRLESCENRTRIFQGRRKRTGRRPSRGALQVPFPYLRTSRFHGHGPLRRRENSSRGSRRRLRARLRHRGFAREATRRHRHCCQQRRHPRALSESGFGNINPIPFRRKAGRSSFVSVVVVLLFSRTTNECDRLTDPAPFGKTFACVLGPTDPCSTAVGTEPFSTSVFEGLVRIFATTTEICTRGRLHPGSRPRLPCSPRRPPTRRGIGQARASFSSAQALLAATVRHRSVAPAPSIFGAGRFGR